MSSEETSKPKRSKVALPILALIVVAGGIYAYRSWSFGQTHASTDDAQVASRVAALSPKVAGTITEVKVEDNQRVKAGDLVALIDPKPFEIAVSQARANLDLAEAQAEQAKANIGLTETTGSAQITQAEGGIAQTEGSIEGSLAEVQRAQAAVSTAQAQASGAQTDVSGARAALAVAQANVSKAQDGVREAQSLAANARAAVRSAVAQVEAARATEDRAAKDDARYQQLLNEGVISAAAADQTSAALKVARANRTAAEENVRSARAALGQREAAIQTAQSNVVAANASVGQARSAIRSEQDRAKASSESVRQSQAGVLAAQTQVTQAKARQAQAGGVLKQAQTAPTQVELTRHAYDQAVARIEQAKAALADAELKLSYTRIVAPINGRISRRTVTVGQQVVPGSNLLSIVPESELWVVANFKETQLEGMKPNQPVEIEVDAFGGEPLKGKVDSFSAGTGATFALLPPDNATGNFTKVVQRVPVKIVFDANQPRLSTLAVGMSVVVTVEKKG